MPKQKTPLLTRTITPTGAVPAYRAVSAAGAQIAAVGATVFGVSATAIPAGKAGPVDIAGTTLIESGGVFDVGDRLIADTQGRAIEAPALSIQTGATALESTSEAGAFLGAILPNHAFAVALESASGAGKIVEILLR